MLLLIFLILSLLSPLLFFIKAEHKNKLAFAFVIGGLVNCILWAVEFFRTGQIIEGNINTGLLGPLHFYIDSLSLFFILLINVGVLTSFWYSKKYLPKFNNNKTSVELSIHYISKVLLYYSMVCVVILRDGGSFLFAWELMTLASFIAILLNGERTNQLRIAIQYMVQMHIVFFVLIAAFTIVHSAGYSFGFDGLAGYFANHNSLIVFMLFFIGFGLKSGFVPLHSWLPETYSIAPGNISGLMSGVVTKMGIYGLMRVVGAVQQNIFEIAVILLSISIITGLFGIVMAIVQKDIKRLLAYSSIENIGIIGMGLALGLLGKYWDNTTLALAGFAGALIHTLNHSFYKSILFFTIGLISKGAQTQNIDQLGGLIKRMPKTSLLFLFGTIGLCALPPLNGFFSKFLFYSGLFSAVHNNDVIPTLLIMLSVIVLTLIGGLSVMAFAKVFGISFLGEPRSKDKQYDTEDKALLKPLLLPLIIAIIPLFYIQAICNISWNTFSVNYVDTLIVAEEFNQMTLKLALVYVVLFTVFGIIWYIRRKVQARKVIEQGPTWGCGYTAVTPKQQYTSASFISDFELLTNPITRYKRDMEPIREDEIFPEPRIFRGKGDDIIRSQLVNKPSVWLGKRFFRLAIFQTGRLQHYITYALLFMLLIIALTYFNLI